MGALSRTRFAQLAAPGTGRHRGQPAPLVDLGPAAARAGVVLATGATAATVVVSGAGSASAAPAYGSPSQFAALRQCESSGNYAINTGNGYYGAYQFDIGTWRGLGYAGLPSQASAATQDQAAARLQAARGWSPWPACSHRLGLVNGVAPTAPAPARPAPTAPARPVQTTGVPVFPGTTLTQSLVSQRRADVLIWQGRMARRGWTISIDGHFGPQSAHVAQAFAAEKRVSAPAGTVTSSVWTAAWTAPIT